MKKAIFAMILVIVCLMLFAFPAASGAQNLPAATLMPYITFGPVIPMDPIVDIPDANLRALLHTKTGVPSAQPIKRSHLAALLGTLNFSDKEITNAEGVQYCVNITTLDLSENSLSNLPSLTGMTGLRVLKLNSCNLHAWPSGKMPTGLAELQLSSNGIDALPNSIPETFALKKLYLRSNGFVTLPDWLFGLSQLELLDLSANHIKVLPAKVSDLTNLVQIFLDANELESLPDSICTMPKLRQLYVSRNGLYSLPANIGNSKLYGITARFNKLNSLPASIGSSTEIGMVNVTLNRLTSLPSNFDDHTYDYVDLEFNFLNVAAGSSARNIIDNTECMDKRYKRQLSLLKVEAEAFSDHIELSWQGGTDGAGGGATWKVKGFVVYLEAGGTSTKLADIDKSETSYTHASLSAGTKYEYRVGVDYEVKIPADSFNVILRNYTAVTATTLTASGATVSLAPTLPVGPGATSSGFPVWAIALIAVGGIGIGVIATVLIGKKKKA